MSAEEFNKQHEKFKLSKTKGLKQKLEVILKNNKKLNWLKGVERGFINVYCIFDNYKNIPNPQDIVWTYFKDIIGHNVKDGDIKYCFHNYILDIAHEIFSKEGFYVYWDKGFKYLKPKT